MRLVRKLSLWWLSECNIKMKQKQNMTGMILFSLIFAIIFMNIFYFGYLSDNSIEGNYLDKISGPKTLTIAIDELPHGVDASYSNSIRESISYWEKREDVIFKEVSSDEEANVRVQWVKEFGGEHLGYAMGGFVEIGLGDSLCNEKWQAYSYESVLHISKHELGHVLGYEHSEDINDLMYFQVLTKYNIDINEKEILHDGWFMAYSVCTKQDSAEYVIKVNSDEELNIYVVPSIEDYESFKEGEEFSYFQDCKGEGVRFYKKTCGVSSGSIIILENPYGSSQDYSEYEIEVREV